MAADPSASAFSLPIPVWQQTPSLRVAKYESRKRKIQDDTGDESDGYGRGDEGETTDAVSDYGYTAQSIVLSPDEARQYRVAGLSFDEKIPGGHFPHGPVKENNRTVNNRGSILKQLSTLSPPIYTPESAAHQGNLRLRHLAVLTSMLHRCLLEGDYLRAGRAWGIIIREQFSGHSIDVRAEDRWGIGAEILLRKDHQKKFGKVAEGANIEFDQPHMRDNKLPKLLFTRKGFEDAKEYYETLIVQHPYQKTAPNATSALHFYIAMFGLWIYVAQEESTSARRALDERDTSSYRETWDDDDEPPETDNRNGWKERHNRLTAGIRANELAEADRIAGRMDGILTSPPYSDSPQLLELRGMVSLWIADLLVSSVPSSGQSDDDEEEEDNNNNNDDSYNDYDGRNLDDDNDVFMSTAEPASVQARRERRLAMEKRQSELAKSEEFMNKARQRKRGVSSRLADFHIEDDMSENRQHQPRLNDPQLQSRQALAEQARVEVPQTTLVAPVPLSNRQAAVHRYGSPIHDQGPIEKPVHRDAFDTDVENIDESTIAATSVIGNDDVPYRMPHTAVALTDPESTIQIADMRNYPPQPSPSPPRQFRAARRNPDSKWYEGLGDRALKSAGFDLDDGDDTSQLTSTAGDDEQSNDTDDQRYVPRYRGGEEPLSRRLQSFWSASRKRYDPDDGEQTEPTKPQSYIPVASTTKALPASSRKVTLPRSMTATPRTRFSPPKPSLLEQLDLTPTHHSTGITRTHSRKAKEREKEPTTTAKPIDNLQVPDEGLGLFTETHKRTRQDSLQSLNAFDLTNFDDLENDSSMNDPFSRRTSIRRIATDTSETQIQLHGKSTTKKRPLEPDYPPEILCTKSFTELQEEPFDKTPTPTASKPKEATSQTIPEKDKDEDKISFLLRLTEQERGEYFSKLPMGEWEECGDVLINQFSKMMVKMKDLRHERRKTAAVFEAEIKRRNDLVEEQSKELTGKFEEMRAGGVEVLRGRSP
ncbi:extracellular mutant protein 11-domain-containing protein [Aspergillus karnatakaensis]|uniref:extracellular mutant protein 11-domain-containing protein n=1 Tax=Aspergillus karnatakaensis TaxID=1810916 RepID=UPI003CCCF070